MNGVSDLGLITKNAFGQYMYTTMYSL